MVNHESSSNGDGTTATRNDAQVGIVGYSCRLPGGVADGPSYWNLLTEGRDAITEIPADRWSIAAYYADSAQPGLTQSRWGGFLDRIDEFDAECFGISPREARHIDPQQRLLLEATYEALESAGIPFESLVGSRTGVFIGISTGDYGRIQSGFDSLDELSSFTAQGSSHSIAANRISYSFDLRGPSFIVDTACSSTLVAFDRACRSLRLGECDLAIAGGVNIVITPETFVCYSQASMLAPDGRCKAFDASANGFVRSEGGGVFVLRRVDDAERHGDRIYATVLGSATNQDGRTSGLAMPNPAAQEDILREVYRDANVDPSTVPFVEAHGTGTAVGDPSEAVALGRVFSDRRTTPLIVGSCKTNIGHLEAASGVASLCKVLLMFAHREIPPNLHFRTPNPHINFDELGLRVPTTGEQWPDGAPLIAGINSFGFGGANAHVILSAPKATSAIRSSSSAALEIRRPSASSVSESDGRPMPIVLSARSQSALKTMAEEWLQRVRNGHGGEDDLIDAAFSAATRRTHHRLRLAFVARDASGVGEQLERYLADEKASLLHTGECPAAPPQRVFLFCGQGPQRARMGAESLQAEPVFADAIAEIDSLLKPIVDWSIIEELCADESASRIDRTSVAQPALFAIQVATARLLEHWGIRPDVVIGHSVGEIAAAHVSGALSLRDAVGIIGHRGICLEEHALTGAMVAAALSRDAAEKIIESLNVPLNIAAVNGPQSLTIAGSGPHVEQCVEALRAKDIWCRQLDVNHAFHSHLVEEARAPFLDAVPSLKDASPHCTMVSTVLARAVDASELDADYWWQNIRQPVRFMESIRQIDEASNVYFEIGPHPVLGSSVQQSLRNKDATPTLIASLQRGLSEHDALIGVLAGAFAAGVPVDWTKQWSQRRFVELPRHPWERERYWSETAESQRSRLRDHHHPLLGFDVLGASARQPDGGTSFASSTNSIWRTRIDAKRYAWIQDHRVGEQTVFPAAAFLELVLAAAVRSLQVDTLAVDDFDILRALVCSQDSSSVVHVMSNPESGVVSIHSRRADGHAPQQKHVEAVCRSIDPFDAARLDVRSWCSGARPISVDDFFASFKQVGLHYGPSFRGVRELYGRPDSALGRIELPTTIADHSADYLFHPALLDAGFQVLLAALPNLGGDNSKMYLPERIKRVRVLRQVGTSAWSEVRIRQATELRVVADILLYDAEGRLALDVTRFECRAVLNRKHDQSDAKSLIYATRWHQNPIPELPPAPERLTLETTCKELAEAAHRSAASVWNDTSPDSMMDGTDRLALEYMIQSFEELSIARNGGIVDLPQLTTAGLVVEGSAVTVARWLEHLEQAGLAVRHESGWRMTGGDPPTESELWLRALEEQPQMFPMMRLLEICRSQVEGLLSGQVHFTTAVFSEEGMSHLEQVYRDTPFARYANRFVQTVCLDALHRQNEARALRILEVGAGFGGTTAYVLQGLPERRIDYTFTDVSSFFISRAEDTFRAATNVRSQTLDLDADLASQGFTPGMYDVVIAADVLHATRNVDDSLRRCHDLLAPGGCLLVRELTRPRPWLDYLFGFADGWWTFRGDPRRPHHAILNQVEWLKALNEAGFADCDSPHSSDAIEDLGTVIVARKSHDAALPQAPTVVEAQVDEQNWIIFADSKGTSDAVSVRLAGSGRRCVLVRAGRDFERIAEDVYCIDPENADHFTRLRDDADLDSSSIGIVHYWSVDVDDRLMSSEGGESVESLVCHSLVHAIQAWSTANRIVVVTRGAFDLDDVPRLSNVMTGSVQGLARVARNELPTCNVQLVDLDPSDGFASAVWNELVTEDRQSEVAWRGTRRLVPRLERGFPDSFDENVRDYEVALGHVGDLSNIELVQVTSCEPGDDEVQVDIHFAGLNFRDTLKALGQYPATDPNDTGLGDECTGVVRAVGSSVDHLQPGDRVVLCAGGCLRSTLTVRASRVRPLGERVSASSAATLPIATATVNHALITVGQLSPGDSVLIHSAAGGVGLAAIQLARSVGATVFATAGSPGKRQLVRQCGASVVMDSRRLDFYDEVMDATGGRGVDVVLNSLAGKAMERSLACVAENGRFLELGVRDYMANTRVGLRPLGANVSYSSIGPTAVQRVLATEWSTATRMDDVTVHSLVQRVFPVARITDAFRLMSQGRHLGKLVIDMQQHWCRIRQPASDFVAKENATYLVTGAFGGVGIEVARWLVDRGARHLLLVSRRGEPTNESAVSALASLRDAGVNVRTVACDVARRSDVSRLMQTAAVDLPELRGVFHLAMVLDDGTIANMTRERFLTVTRPKLHGAMHLHELTRDCPLDCFVMFSSVSASMGNPGQSNYAAANSGLEALAAFRRRQGMPGVAIGWGVLGDVGYVADREELKESLRRLAFEPMTTDEIRQVLDLSMTSSSPTAVAVRINWTALAKRLPSSYPSLLSSLITATASTDDTSNIRQRLSEADPDDRSDIVLQLTRSRIGQVLGLAEEKIDVARPISELGLDSLMAVEVANMIERDVGVAVPVTGLSHGVTVQALSDLVLGVLDAGNNEHEAASVDASRSAETVVVSLRDGEDGNLFCFQPAGGELRIYDELVARLPAGPAVYGVKRGVEEYRSIADMADSCAATIDSTQPEGPIRLLGFSMGGLLAARVAECLEETGRQVKFLGVIESDPRPSNQVDRLTQFLCATYELIRAEMGMVEELAPEQLRAEAAAVAENLTTRSVVDWVVGGDHIVGSVSPKLVEDYLSRIGSDLILMMADDGQPRRPLMTSMHVWRMTDGLGADASVWSEWTQSQCRQLTLEGDHFSAMLGAEVDAFVQSLSSALSNERPAIAIDDARLNGAR